MARDLELEDLRSIDEDHFHLLGLVLRAPAQLRTPHTPKNVLNFAGSPVDVTTFGFVVDGASVETLETLADLAARPVWIQKRHRCCVVPNLRAFLSLLALAGANAIRDCDSDETWLLLHAESMSEPEFRAASEALCQLPGVSLPAEPCSLVTRLDEASSVPGS